MNIHDIVPLEQSHTFDAVIQREVNAGRIRFAFNVCSGDENAECLRPAACTLVVQLDTNGPSGWQQIDDVRGICESAGGHQVGSNGEVDYFDFAGIPDARKAIDGIRKLDVPLNTWLLERSDVCDLREAVREVKRQATSPQPVSFP